MKRLFRAIVLIWLFLSATYLTSCTAIKIDSIWKGQEIVVDGTDNEWQGYQIVPSGESVALGIMNDNSDLYVSFRTPDQNVIVHAISLGFTIWIDPKGGKKKTLGIKYPIGGRESEIKQLIKGGYQSPEEREVRIKDLLAFPSGIEIIGPKEGSVQRIAEANSTGVEVKVNYIQDQFIYEMKFPLKKTPSNLYAINVEPGDVIGIGFKTGEIDREVMQSQRSIRGGSMGGSKGGSGGGMGGGRGGGKGGGRSGRGRSSSGNSDRQLPEPLEVWTKVTLANPS